MMLDSGEKILLVDDEPLIVDFLARFARKRGFDPTVAHNGLDAWKLFEGAPATWGLLITDIRLPGLDGVSLARRVRESGSDLPVVFISGHGEPPDVDALSPAVFLPKPFKWAQLLEAIRMSVAEA